MPTSKELASVQWHAKDGLETLALLGGSRKGFSDEEAQEHRTLGVNKITHRREETWVQRIGRQLSSPLVLILVVAAAITSALGEGVDTAVIIAALVVNIFLGLAQEGRAKSAFKKLQKAQAHTAQVQRDGVRKTIDATEVVMGDIVFLEAGKRVPADVRLLETSSLEIQEAALTGEWNGVLKHTEAVSTDTPLYERTGMAWSGTVVTGGFGTGVVVAVGDDTQIGKIAQELGSSRKADTPVEVGMKKVATFITSVVVICAAVLVVVGIFQGRELKEMFLVAVAVAVSAVPEGLPAAVTATLAVGMEKILKHGGLVRNLLAAETLGSTTIILTDKTGTLTEGFMKLSSIITLKELQSRKKDEGDQVVALEAGLRASDAFLETGGEEKVVRGRPVERAIMESALSYGIDPVLSTEGRTDFLPFSSEHRFAASLHTVDGKHVTYLSGAPETLISVCSKVRYGGEEISLDKAGKERILAALEHYSSEGKRITATAYYLAKTERLEASDGKKLIEKIENVTFAGLLVFSDPVRADVPAAIKTSEAAGARVVVVTGDNPYTARAIAVEAAVTPPNPAVVVGSEIEEMNDEELLEALYHTDVFARVAPLQKLRIARVLRENGEVVAMTGDGVNDAPALRNANIGIAVQSGTEVAKESSDLVLMGNSFSIIVEAIREGRRIMDNLKKIFVHLVSTSFGEIFLIAGALLLALPLPVLPLQILWVNIVQGGLLNFAFAFEPAEKGVMQRNPREEEYRSVLTKDVTRFVMATSFTVGLFTLFLFVFLTKELGLGIEEARTVMFGALALDAVFLAVSLKNLKRPLWKIEPFSNMFLILSITVSFVLFVLTVSLAPIRELLGLGVLSSIGIVAVLVAGCVNIFVAELFKFLLFWRKLV